MLTFIISSLLINQVNTSLLTKEQRQIKVYDYIFLCFFLGNDFLPHFPALNIRTGGIDKLITAYKETIKDELCLVDGKKIHWNNVKELIKYLANKEEYFFINEHRSRNNKSKHLLINNSTPEEQFKNFESIPIINREIEYFINPIKPHWQNRYYRSLFKQQNININDISINYLQGLEWTMKYYISDCPDWRWHYKYDYPPLLKDLFNVIPSENKELFTSTNFNPLSDIVTLSYVLPRESLSLLPEKLYKQLIKKYGFLYKTNYEFSWAYCRYFWESHVLTPDVDINEFEQFVNRITHN